jgi:hypothetical protein
VLLARRSGIWAVDNAKSPGGDVMNRSGMVADRRFPPLGIVPVREFTTMIESRRYKLGRLESDLEARGIDPSRPAESIHRGPQRERRRWTGARTNFEHATASRFFTSCSWRTDWWCTRWRSWIDPN